MVIHQVPNSNIEYYIDKRLKKNLDKKVVSALKNEDEDYVLIFDGKEGSGKSTFSFQVAKYVDPTFNLSRIAFDAETFKQIIFKAKKGQCVVYDEAFTGLSSRASLSGINKYLVSLMMQMRQKNLFVIINLPTFHLLDKYVALFRTKALIHCFKVKGKRGYFKVYNSKLKSKLQEKGKKYYSYPKSVKTNFRGRFYGKFALGDTNIREKYLKMKEKALEEVGKTPMSATQIRFMEQRNILIHLLRKNYNLTYRQIEEMLKEYEIDISYVQIRNICSKFGDKDDIIDEKELKEEETSEYEEEIEEISKESDENDYNDDNSDEFD